MRLDYRVERFEQVSVCGSICESSDMRIEQSTIPKGKYQYEVGGDDGSGGDPAMVQPEVLVNFFGTLVCDEPLPIGNDGVLWLDEGDFI